MYLLSISALGSAAPSQEQNSGWPPVDQAAVKSWQDMRFGMFIHWGPVALTGHEIGWSRGKQTPIEIYDNLYKKFNPTNYNAAVWVDIAKRAGMRYMVLTTKHHDGFCLWPSDVTDYDIAATPFKRDVVGELAQACQEGGLKFGAYYSSCDWRHPAFPNGSPGGRSRKPTPDMRVYADYLQAQISELVTRYGPLVTIWFDVPQAYTAKYGLPMVRHLRQLQPDILINNRAYAAAGSNNFATQNALGDYATPEQKIGKFSREHPWETCMTICHQWAWKPNDKLKPLKQCIRTLVYTIGGDGNLLLNVGPMPDGRIEPRQVKRLEEIGDWVNRHSEAIYATRGGPFIPGKWGASVCKDDNIYLFLMKPVKGETLQLPAINARIKSVSVLNGKPLNFTQTGEGLRIVIPKDLLEPVATVIKMTIDRTAFAITPLKVDTKK